MFSIYYNIHSIGKDAVVVINATGTDCYAQAAAISKKIQDPLALKRKGQLLLYCELCRQNLAEIVVQFYTMTSVIPTMHFMAMERIQFMIRSVGYHLLEN